MAVTPEHIRAAVLADVRGGMSTRDAGLKHGVPKTTVARWAGGATGRPRGQGNRKGVVEPRGANQHGDASTVAPARARGTPPIVETIGPELRRDLRRGVSGIARFIASAGERVGLDGAVVPTSEDDDGPDWQQVAHAARALDILIARVPDLMTFDERTTDVKPSDDTRHVDLAAAMGVDPSAPPSLRLVGVDVAESS